MCLYTHIHLARFVGCCCWSGSVWACWERNQKVEYVGGKLVGWIEGVSGGGAELCAVYPVSHQQENSIESTIKSRSLSAFLKVGFIHVF